MEKKSQFSRKPPEAGKVTDQSNGIQNQASRLKHRDTKNGLCLAAELLVVCIRVALNSRSRVQS